MTDELRGIKIVRKRMADGSTKEYRYDRVTRRRVLGEVDSDAFLDQLATMRAAAPGGRLGLAEYQRSVFLYFIQAESGPIKIGISDNVERRLANIRNQLYEDATLLAVFHGDRRLEQRLHRSLKRYRLRGEWFDPHPHVLRAIEDLAADHKAAPRKLRVETGNQTPQPADTAA
jgi:hypothetical protein